MGISLQTYKGEFPRISPRALPNEAAQKAVMARLLSGDLEAWQDIKDIFSLEPGTPPSTKTGPTNTMSLMAGKYWLNWAEQEIDTADGFQNVDVAVVPIAGNDNDLTIFTGTAGSPRITDLSMAIGGNSSPNGPYPIDSIALAVLAPDTAPTVVNTPGIIPGSSTTTTYVSDFSTWTSGYFGGFGSFMVLAGPGNSALAGPVYQGQFEGANSDWSFSPASFDFANSTSFTLDMDVSPDITNTSQAPNGFIRILTAGGTGTGGFLALNFKGPPHNITWTDQAGGGSQIILANPPLDQFHGVHVKMTATSAGLNPDGIKTFNVAILVTLYGTSTVLASATVTCTYGGENIAIGGVGGTSSDVQNMYFARVAITVNEPPAGFVPVFSNYVYTEANPLGFESPPSPASSNVQVDNNNIDTVTWTVDDPTSRSFFLYRSATGSSGTQYFNVPNGNSPDGGFPLCTVGGTANAITLATWNAMGELQQTSYVFVATATNTGAVTVSVDGGPAVSVDDTSGSPLGAGAIVSGQTYTVEYAAPTYAQVATQATANQNVIAVESVAGISVNSPISDEQGAIVEGSTVTAINTGTTPPQLTLSNPLIDTIGTGDLLTVFPISPYVFTLMDGATYIDATPTADLDVPLATTDFDPPPSNMQGVTALPNSIIAGFDGSEVDLSEQGFPYAFPLQYRLPTDSPIVMIAPIDTTLIILTQSRPYTAYGDTPATFTMTREEFIQGCVAKRSVSFLRGYGIIYASTDGIYAYAGSGVIRNLTEACFTIKEWLPLNPPSIIGIVHQNLYFFWYTKLDGSKGGYILDPTPNGFGLVRMDFHAIAVALNSVDDSLYMVLDAGAIAGGVIPATNELVQFDAADTLRPYTWHSKLWQYGHPTVYENGRIRAFSYDDTECDLYADGSIYATLEPTDLNDFVMPDPGTAMNTFEFEYREVTDTINTTEFGESIDDLITA